MLWPKWTMSWLCLSANVFAIEPHADEVRVYHQLLQSEEETHVLEILSEGARRGLSLPKDITSLWQVPAYRVVILESLGLDECRQLKLFEKESFLKLNSTQQSVILLRAQNDAAWSGAGELLELGKNVYEEVPRWAKNLILAQHRAQKSDQLVKLLEVKTEKSASETKYLLELSPKVSGDDLKFSKAESDFTLHLKLQSSLALSEAERKQVAAEFMKLKGDDLAYAIPFYDDEALLALLKTSEHGPTKAIALKTLLEHHWNEAQAMRVFRLGSWSEGYELYRYLCDHPDRIDAVSFERYWTTSKEMGKTLLSAFLWQHPKAEVSKTLVEHIEKQEQKAVALKAMYALPAHGQSNWLREHVKAKVWDDELRTLALDTLWQWKEVPEDEFYLRLFLDQNYRGGGPGMESLLKLLGLSKNRQAPKIISSYFKEVEEPIVEVIVAVEAAGWHGGKDFLGSLKKMERDGGKDEILMWALARCEGKSPPFPKLEKVEFNFDPYFFHSLDAGE